MQINLEPIAFVKNVRTVPMDDNWGTIESTIELCDEVPTASLDRIEDFSHLEIIYYFDRVPHTDIVFSGHPRGNPAYPVTGIFAQRKKDRLNRIGLCTVELLEHTGRIIRVRNLDAINGTAVIDIKPVFKEFQPRKEIMQPSWVSDLMKHYW